MATPWSGSAPASGIQEVLQGFTDEAAFAAVFEEAVALHGPARRAGLTIRSGVDGLIAACALRHALTVVRRDCLRHNELHVPPERFLEELSTLP